MAEEKGLAGDTLGKLLLTGSVQVQRGPCFSRHSSVPTDLNGQLPPEEAPTRRPWPGGSVGLGREPCMAERQPTTLLPPTQGSLPARKMRLENGPESSSNNETCQGATRVSNVQQTQAAPSLRTAAPSEVHPDSTRGIPGETGGEPASLRGGSPAALEGQARRGLLCTCACPGPTTGHCEL